VVRVRRLEFGVANQIISAQIDVRVSTRLERSPVHRSVDTSHHEGVPFGTVAPRLIDIDRVEPAVVSPAADAVAEPAGGTGAPSDDEPGNQHLLPTVALSDPQRVAAGRFVDDLGVENVDFPGAGRNDDTVVGVVALHLDLDILNPRALTGVEYRQGVTRDCGEVIEISVSLTRTSVPVSRRIERWDRSVELVSSISTVTF
jgi:hypothetical protein